MNYPHGFESWSLDRRNEFFSTKARDYRVQKNGAPLAPGWPKPLPIVATLPAVQSFEGDLLPPSLADYVFDVADRQQSPPDFVAVAALCGLAAVIGNKARINPKSNDDWSVVPNLWGAIIGRPSAMKSPAMRSALAPVFALQDRMRKQWEEDARQSEIESTLASLDAKEAAKQAQKAMKSGDREEARRLLSEKRTRDDEAPPCPRLIINDATVEKAGELLNENPRGLLLVRDELAGFLSRMDSEEFQSERAFYLEAFNGDGQFTYDRIGRGTVHIETCTLSIIGGIQPTRIAPIIRAAMAGANDDGLVQRLQLAVWPDETQGWKWMDRRPDAAAREAYDAAFMGLHKTAESTEGHLSYGFSAHAQGLFKAWMIELQTTARGGNLPSTVESHFLKMPKTAASLALIFHLIDGGEGPVGAEATARALDWTEYLMTHARRIYAAGSMMTESAARLIVDRRMQLPLVFSARDIQRKAWAGLADKDSVASALEMLITNHYCREVHAPAGSTGGRPGIGYEWNPALGYEG